MSNNDKLLADADPIVNVISRILAWESKINAVGLREVDEERLFDLIDDEIGTKISSAQFKSRKKSIDDWREEKIKDWRYLYLPSHREVRTHAHTAVEREFNPNYRENVISMKLAFRNPSLPWLEILIGVDEPPIRDSEYIERRAIYILRHNLKQVYGQDDLVGVPDSLYIGKADDINERMIQHQKPKKPHFWFVAMPAEGTQQFNGDVRDAAEALTIALWSEVARVSNGNLGTTIRPAANADLLYAISLTTAISAAFLYIVTAKRTFIAKDLGISEKLVAIPLLEVHGEENYTKEPRGIKTVKSK